MKKSRGLILGKFAPFHIGHKRLIRIALKEVDELYVLIYDCPNLTSIPLNIRAGWVRHFFPEVNIIEGWDAPNRHEDTPEVKKIQEEYLKKALSGKKITHFFSSEYYGDHVSKSLEAIDRRLNREDPRQKFATTATMIRNGKNLNKNFLDKIVYKDILIKIAFIGIPSYEQLKLVKTIAKKLKTSYVEDNLFKLFKNKQLSINNIDFYKIANKKYKIANTEDKIFSGKEYLIYNSTGFIDHLLSIATHNRFDKKLYDFFSEDMRNYDLIFVNDSLNKKINKALCVNSLFFLNQLINNLNTLGVCYQKISGTFKQKLSISEKTIKSFKKRFNRK